MEKIFLFIAGYLVGYFSCITNKNCSPSKIWLDYMAENRLTKNETEAENNETEVD